MILLKWDKDVYQIIDTNVSEHITESGIVTQFCMDLVVEKPLVPSAWYHSFNLQRKVMLHLVMEGG